MNDRKGQLLRTAVLMRDREMVSLLLEAGASLSHEGRADTVLLAAKYGHEEIVEVLVGAGADVHANGDAAMVAAESGGWRLVVEVLKREEFHVGCDRGFCSKEGRDSKVSNEESLLQLR